MTTGTSSNQMQADMQATAAGHRAAALRRNFGSDNVGPMAPEVLDAIARANAGAMASYGADPLSAELERRISALFERPARVYPVATGTAGNALALAALTPPFGSIFCHEDAHIVGDECGAPEFYTGGAKILGLPGAHGKLDPDALGGPIAAAARMGQHACLPCVLSLTQATEAGTVYTPDEIAALTGLARDHGLAVHMDGARFANAVASLGCAPAELVAGVDVLVFGGTKNGAMAAEAVVFLDERHAENFARRRKRGGQTWSKQRFLAAQLLALLEDDRWLRHAAQANAMAARLAAGLGVLPGAALLHPVQANEVFVRLPGRVIASLAQAGYGFYRWDDVPADDPRRPGIIRLVCGWDTEAADIDALIATAR